MISLTGGVQSKKMNVNLARQNSEAGQGPIPALNDSLDKSELLPQPDNNYLQAMLKQKINMNQGSQSSATLKRSLLPATDIDPNQFEHLLEGTLSPKSSSNQSASNESGTKKRDNILNNSISSYSLRAMKRNAEAN